MCRLILPGYSPFVQLQARQSPVLSWKALLVSFLVLVSQSEATLTFTDFNNTQGLVFNGFAATSSCNDVKQNRYGDVQGAFENFEKPLVEREYSVAVDKVTTVGQLDDEAASAQIDDQTDMTSTARQFMDQTAGSSQRDTFARGKEDRCPVRLRLTPAKPSMAGSVWHQDEVPVMRGFETLFAFTVTDPSRECTVHKDPAFTTTQYRTCSVNGGDGFAFVIHGDSNGTEALGTTGSGIGYESIRNSLAIEFDTWYSTDHSNTSAELLRDHISVHSSSTRANSAGPESSLGTQAAVTIADGRHHLVKIAYTPSLAMRYAPYFSASEILVEYLKDGGENRRLGTLLVFVDDGIALDTPSLAMPINLALLLRLPLDSAYVGFTAATGRRWQTHDILSWLWCDRTCDETDTEALDYARQTPFIATRHAESYGAEDLTTKVDATLASQGAPPKARKPFPDTAAIQVDEFHHSRKRNYGLSPDADSQVPPSTPS